MKGLRSSTTAGSGVGAEGATMGKATIFYFTATGNSLAVARGLAARIGASLTPVASTLGRDQVETDAEVIGFVFPIYDFKAPKIVDELVGKLVPLDGMYLFVVCTYGISAGQSLKRLEKTVEDHGGHLSGEFAVPMPHNGVGCGNVPRAKRSRILHASVGKTEKIANYIQHRVDGTVESSRVLPALIRPWMLRTVPTLVRFAFSLVVKGEESLALTASGACNGCGICVEVCPADNIEMHGARPRWGDRCIGCFACLHWCPQRAISLGGQAMGIEPYHHPDVTLSDMMDAKR